MDDFTLDAVSVVFYAGLPVLMYRWTGDTTWHRLYLS